jgi:uncharacterized membrane protein YhaH (DUF805 family)
MIKLFQSGNCGQILYFCLLFFLLGFDFAKDPIERYLVGAKEDIQQQIYARDGTKIAVTQQSFIDGQRALSGSQRPVEGLRTGDHQTQGASQPDPVQDHAAGIVAQALAMEAKSSAVGAVYVSILVALGFATLAAIIWMVFARVRDIGWPAWVGFGVLAPKLAISVFRGDLPLLAFDALQYGFFGALIILGFVPGGFFKGQRSRPAMQTVTAEPIARVRGQFGHRRV